MHFEGTVFRYGRDVDTDAIIPARYLNTSDPAELAKHAMEDIDVTFVQRVKPGDIVVGLLQVHAGGGGRGQQYGVVHAAQLAGDLVHVVPQGVHRPDDR